MRILITGASGLLGLNLALELAGRHTVFGVTNRHALQTNRFKVIQTDLLAPGSVESVLECAQPDWVIHCAALADLDACEADPKLASQLNTELPCKLASHVARGGARLVHISTDAVFDGVHGDYYEEDTPNPLSVYARTKLEAERLIMETNSEAIITRVNLFGWSLTGKRSLAEFFFNNLKASNPMKGFTDVFVCPLLANHLASIFTDMLEKGLSGLYHVVSRVPISKYEFGVALAKRFELDETLISPCSVNDAGLKAARSPNLTLCTDKLTKALSASLPTVTDGIERFYELYREGYPQYLKGLVRGE
ncbi:MAG: SDR family oxidoreductase [Anaerolineales bacterium]|nr:SDR family oxidoreductase [Anaerolineales bacterium]